MSYANVQREKVFRMQCVFSHQNVRAECESCHLHSFYLLCMYFHEIYLLDPL